jgi:CSLREA domain-containing protein
MNSAFRPRSTSLDRLPFLRLFLVVAFIYSLFPSIPPAYAATTINVTTTTDEWNADGDCSLREAIRAANTDTAVDACPAGSGTDTINLPAGTYTLTLVGANENLNATGDLDITANVTIAGASAATTIIDGNEADRVFHVTAGGFTPIFQDLTVQNGNVAGPGGGIQARSIALTNVNIKSNTTATGGRGGGVYTDGATTITGSLFQDNLANGYGGGYYHY